MDKNKMQNKKSIYSKLFFIATIIFIGVIGYLLILGLMQVFGWTYPSKGLIISWVALGVFCFTIIFSFVKHKFTYKKIGTYAMHLSMILVLIGTFIYYVGGTSYKVYLKLSTPSDMVLYNKVGEYSFKNGIAEQDKYGNYIYSRSENVNFDFALTDFKIQYHDAECRLVRLDNNDNVVEVIQDEIYPLNGYYDLGKYGKLALSSQVITVPTFKNTSDENVKAMLVPQAVKKYTATLFIQENGKETYKTILVNKPVRYDKWKIMLMSYDTNSKYAVFDFKYNPGEYLTDTSFIILMFSTFYVCLIQPNLKWKSKTQIEQNGKGGELL